MPEPTRIGGASFKSSGNGTSADSRLRHAQDSVVGCFRQRPRHLGLLVTRHTSGAAAPLGVLIRWCAPHGNANPYGAPETALIRAPQLRRRPQ